MNSTSPGGTWGRLLDRADAVAPGAIVALCLLLTWVSQISLRLKGAARIPIYLIAAAVLSVAVIAVFRSRWWRSRPVQCWLAWWVAWAGVTALAWTSIPEQARPSASAEVTMMAACAALSGASILLGRGSRRGVLGYRWAWAAVLMTTAPVAIREVVANEHIIVTKWVVWYFHAHVPAGPFANPNNYGCVLVAVTGVLLAWSLDQRRRSMVALLLVGAAGATWLTWRTESRGAFAAIAVQVLITAVGAAARWGWWRAVARSPRARRTAIAAGAAFSALAVAMFAVPALAAHNPLLRSPKAQATVQSDGLRWSLVEAGLRYWREHPLWGTGPGTFEYELGRERPAGVPDPTINAHNAFVEILSQYGLVVAVPLAVLLAVLLWRVVRPQRRLSGEVLRRAERHAQDSQLIAYRVEIAVLCVAFVITAIVVSTALALPMWFLMLAHMVTTAWAMDEPVELTGRERE
ncbi:hypothetical protein KEM60_00825 [Austwickia sp. TVS 96-490-7B]|uniref:O-antigen ligase family protein n=1 Tax=Austwickia sp. TVS 96-490-7B TaxID=2830843 RepID=UPI001C595E79|nr:O-antigen ligase family protein [Austwickia sp. TVS 96-490-7B]MBW3084636.1 hypothetical protein [Austwickia sp. TVS 96-490-7B]